MAKKSTGYVVRASVMSGDYGQPGDQYHVASAALAQHTQGKRWRVTIIEKRGSNQGFLEDYEYSRWRGYGLDAAHALNDAAQAYVEATPGTPDADRRRVREAVQLLREEIHEMADEEGDA